MRRQQWMAAVICAATIACGGSSSGTPTDPTPNGPTLTAPVPEGPGDAEQLSTLRPTLTVRNGTSNQTTAKTYEFQISDRSDFASQAPPTTFAVVVTRTNVAETPDRTSFTVDSDLQPTTRFYWRARVTQSGTSSAWSATRTFNSKLMGYIRNGDLYDPLIHSETIGTIVGSTTWVPGRGIRLNDQNAYVRYQLAQTISNGQFSVEVEGLSANGPGAKLKVFSMLDGTGDLLSSKYLMNVQYRGVNGNPDNAISYKAVYGDGDLKLEPDLGTRLASVMSLNPTVTYHWRALWSSTQFRLIIEQGGIGGQVIYDRNSTTTVGNYAPSPHFAYLGANNAPFGVEEGTWPGVTYRNVWVSEHARPASLGSALSSVNRK